MHIFALCVALVDAFSWGTLSRDLFGTEMSVHLTSKWVTHTWALALLFYGHCFLYCENSWNSALWNSVKHDPEVKWTFDWSVRYNMMMMMMMVSVGLQAKLRCYKCSTSQKDAAGYVLVAVAAPRACWTRRKLSRCCGKEKSSIRVRVRIFNSNNNHNENEACNMWIPFWTTADGTWGNEGFVLLNIHRNNIVY